MAVAALVAFGCAVTAVAVSGGTEDQRLLVEDGFDRTMASGWGSAPVGGAYSATWPLTGLAVQRSTATVVLPTERSGRSVWLPSAGADDVSVQADLAFQVPPAGFGQIAAITMRKDARRQEYRARVRFAGDRSLRLSFSKIVDSTPERLIGPELVVARSIAPGTGLTLAAAVSGDTAPTLLASAWTGGGAAPPWQLRHVDQTLPVGGVGGVGLWFYAGGGQTGGAPITVSSLSATNRVPAGPTASATPTAIPTIGTVQPAPTPVPSTVSASPSPTPTATGGSPSAPAGRPTATAGAPPLGSTRYPVPANAIVVAPNGSDSAAGTAAAPLRTIARAAQIAPLGATVVLRGGVYHESVEVPANRRITLQNWPGEAVWLDGSRVIGSWTRDGTAWRHDGWTPQFDSSVPAASSPDFDMIDSAYPMASHPEQLWLDGSPLRQVGSRSAVGPGTFFVDTAADRLFIGSSPDGHQVRATDLAEAICLNRSAGSVVRGIGVRRYATPVKRMGMVKAYGDNQVLADLHVDSSATTGISVHAANVRVERTTVVGSGQLGIHAHHADGLVLSGNRVRDNNREHFAEIPVAGGIKITTSRHIRVYGNAVLGNRSTGIWLDESVYDAKVTSNDVTANTRHGIYFELSAVGLIADNVVVDNGDSGIRVADSANARIWNNTVLRNAMAVDIQDGPRVATDLSIPGHDRRQPLPDPNVTWVVKNIQVRNNIVDVGTRTGTWCLFRADDATNQKTADQMQVSGDYDVYVRPSRTQLPSLVAWSNRPNGVLTFGSLADFRSRTGQEAHGSGFDVDTASVLVSAAAGGDLRLRPDSAARGRGAPLPADIAAALGRAAGAVVDPGAFFG